MRYHVLSVRIPQAVLTYCYDILKLGGIPTDNMPMSTAIVTALERLSSSLIQDGRLRICENDDDAEGRLAAYIKPTFWAGNQIERLNTNLIEQSPIQMQDGGDITMDRKSKVEILLERAINSTLEQEEKRLEQEIREDTLYNEREEPIETTISKDISEMDMIDE